MRLLTRSDFDGLICGALLTHLGVVDSWKFVHPKDVQDGLEQVTTNDILANVPYLQGVGMWFDHHSSEVDRITVDPQVKGLWKVAPSCARNIYDYYGGELKLPQFKEMLHAVDKVDSADLTADEIANPKDWILLGFLMDPRTGLGRFKSFRIGNYELMEALMLKCATSPINEILELPDVKERIVEYKNQEELFKSMLLERTVTKGNVIVTDLRGVETIQAGNRFLVYSLFPDQNVSLWITLGRDGKNVPIAVGHSIINKTCGVDIGLLMSERGGGGHQKVGTCQVSHEEADAVIAELIDKLNQP